MVPSSSSHQAGSETPTSRSVAQGSGSPWASPWLCPAPAPGSRGAGGSRTKAQFHHLPHALERWLPALVPASAPPIHTKTPRDLGFSGPETRLEGRRSRWRQQGSVFSGGHPGVVRGGPVCPGRSPADIRPQGVRPQHQAPGLSSEQEGRQRNLPRKPCFSNFKLRYNLHPVQFTLQCTIPPVQPPQSRCRRVPLTAPLKGPQSPFVANPSPTPGNRCFLSIEFGSFQNVPEILHIVATSCATPLVNSYRWDCWVHGKYTVNFLGNLPVVFQSGGTSGIPVSSSRCYYYCFPLCNRCAAGTV